MHVAQVFGAPSNTRGKEVPPGRVFWRGDRVTKRRRAAEGSQEDKSGNAGSRDRRIDRRTEPSGRRLERLAMTVRDTDMQVLWLATVTYHLGLGMQQVVLGWVVLALTHSEAMVGAVFAVRSAPNLVVGFCRRYAY